MTFSEELLLDWEKHSINSVGEILPINYIGLSDGTDDENEKKSLHIGYSVPDSSPPLTTKTDRKVRMVTIYFDIESLAFERKH